MNNNYSKTASVIKGFKKCIYYIKSIDELDSLAGYKRDNIEIELSCELENIMRQCLAIDDETTKFYMISIGDDFRRMISHDSLESLTSSNCNTESEIPLIDVINKYIYVFQLLNSTFQLTSLIDIITCNTKPELRTYYIDNIYKTIIGMQFINKIFNILKKYIYIYPSKLYNLDKCIHKCWDIIVNESYDTTYNDKNSTAIVNLIIPEKIIEDDILYIRSIDFYFKSE